MLRMQYTKFRIKITFQKHSILFLKWPFITPAPLTPAFINATRKNNADLGPGVIRAHKVTYRWELVQAAMCRGHREVLVGTLLYDILAPAQV